MNDEFKDASPEEVDRKIEGELKSEGCLENLAIGLHSGFNINEGYNNSSFGILDEEAKKILKDNGIEPSLGKPSYSIGHQIKISNDDGEITRTYIGNGEWSEKYQMVGNPPIMNTSMGDFMNRLDSIREIDVPSNASLTPIFQPIVDEEEPGLTSRIMRNIRSFFTAF